ncbi:uncharacterized protein LOC110977285 [Acanthaster planci]|uniref:Large ribosomal subunit protein bL34m n=1 Tax=Acanthaster planci TaxID=133434 RepID=A0A8B7Y3R7_ACAPL|nr:uncharacterized protein LOC110977285 [Acanthaster planci]XP_022086959.1 uncharacterized protein LOC110977285 [Acanthaster planci]XP_022086960.1 uncharacterized protein LOC110977285 [Acanthaster planci]
MSASFLAATRAVVNRLLIPTTAVGPCGLDAGIRTIQRAFKCLKTAQFPSASLPHRTLTTGPCNAAASHWWLAPCNPALRQRQLLLQHHRTPSLVPCCFKARGMEYQPSNVKRKRKHGFHKRMRSNSGIRVIWRRLLKGRRLLTH